MNAKHPTDVLPQRMVAWILDGVMLGVVYWGTFFAFAEKQVRDDDSQLFASLTLGDSTYAVTGGKAAVFFALWTILWVSYLGVLPGLRGWTPGKYVLGLRVVSPSTGLPPGGGRGVGRAFGTIIDAIPYVVPMVVGLVAAATSPTKRRIADRLADTVVIREDALGSPVSLDGVAAAAAPVVPVAPAAETPATGPPPNWYPDPSGEKRLRYWDGSAWTDHTAD